MIKDLLIDGIKLTIQYEILDDYTTGVDAIYLWREEAMINVTDFVGMLGQEGAYSKIIDKLREGHNDTAV